MTEQQEFGCKTCNHFVGKMTNYFGVDQPFCKNPKMIEYYKSLPKDPGVSEDKQHVWLPSHVIREADLWFAPLSKSDVVRTSILGCASHSSRPAPPADISAKVKEIREMAVLTQQLSAEHDAAIRKDERERVLKVMTNTLTSRLIMETSLTTEQYKEVMHEIRFLAESLRHEGAQ